MNIAGRLVSFCENCATQADKHMLTPRTETKNTGEKPDGIIATL